MPNYVENRVRFLGADENKLAEIRALVASEDKDFDFNKIIPMPESLNMTSGSVETEAIEACLSSINPEMPDCGTEKITIENVQWLCGMIYISNHFSIPECTKTFEEIQAAAKRNNMSVKEFLELGAKYLVNLLQYGATTWYDWCCNNWGTKWNACDPAEVDDGVLEFNTAWATPYPVLKKLSEMLGDDIDIEVTYLDEDWFGGNCGTYLLRGGEEIESYRPETTSEIKEFINEHFGYDCDDDEQEELFGNC